MITIIISSYNSVNYSAIVENVSATIGVPYEIIKIDNPGLMSMAEAYNKGINKAQYEILCFCHEDILFHTHNWGIKLLETFNNSSIGVLGVTGTKEFGALPIGWWNFNWFKNSTYLVQSSLGDKSKYYDKNFKCKDSIEEVLIIDGLFLASKKSNSLIFNEDFKGYHGYDISYCMESLKKGYKNYVTNRFLIEHFSGGNLNKDWIKTLCFFNKYYKDDLKKIKNYDAKIAMEALKVTIVKAYDFKLKFISNQYWFKLICHNPFSKFHVWFLLYRLCIFKK